LLLIFFLSLISYSLEMQQNDEEWKEVASIDDSLAYTVKNLTQNVAYRFRVRAENVHGCSEPSKPTDKIILTKPIEQVEESEPSTVPEIKQGGEFKTRFEIQEELGKGRFGIVHKVVEKETGLTWAAKTIKCLKAMDRIKVQDEIRIMRSLQHPKLLQLSASFETAKEIIMVME
jgi:serine/threonine protein kinase